MYKILISAFIISLLNPSLLRADVKVAFIGDQGITTSAQAVLKLIKDEEADLIINGGDLGYRDKKANKWEEIHNEYLGEQFPMLTVVGNHEHYEWDIYKRLITKRIDRVAATTCTGDIGVKSTCRYTEPKTKNGVTLDVVQTAPGILMGQFGIRKDDTYDEYIRDSFAKSNSDWRICSFHKNQTAMQLGSKPNETGWDVYNACLDAGAIVATAHEHNYSRTHLMSNFEKQTIAHKKDVMKVEPGKSFAFVSGLGGVIIRKQKQDGEWWASKYTSTQNAKHGALFCTFKKKTAHCYFKDVAGNIPDRFQLTTTNAPVQPVDPTPTPKPSPTPAAAADSSDAKTIVVIEEVRNELATYDHNPTRGLKTVYNDILRQTVFLANDKAHRPSRLSVVSEQDLNASLKSIEDAIINNNLIRSDHRNIERNLANARTQLKRNRLKPIDPKPTTAPTAAISSLDAETIKFIQEVRAELDAYDHKQTKGIEAVYKKILRHTVFLANDKKNRPPRLLVIDEQDLHASLQDIEDAILKNNFERGPHRNIERRLTAARKLLKRYRLK